MRLSGRRRLEVERFRFIDCLCIPIDGWRPVSEMSNRYNGYRAAVVNGAAKPGFSSGQALAALESVSAATLPLGYSFEWTGTAFQEKAATSARIIDPCTCSGRAPSFPAPLPRMRVTMSAGSTCPGAHRVPAVGTSLRQIAVSTEFY
jgi:AcrB/AcrD/AcrF family